jgi:hypothetical protein
MVAGTGTLAGVAGAGTLPYETRGEWHEAMDA